METEIEKIQRILGKKKGRKKRVVETTRGCDRHVWTISEEKLALMLYNTRASEEQVKAAVENTALKLTSMKMKLQNIAYLDTGEGLSNVSSLTRRLFEESRR